MVSEQKIGSHDLKESSSEQVRGLGCHHGVTYMACIPLTEHWEEKEILGVSTPFFSSLILALSDLSFTNESKSVMDSSSSLGLSLAGDTLLVWSWRQMVSYIWLQLSQECGLWRQAELVG